MTKYAAVAARAGDQPFCEWTRDELVAAAARHATLESIMRVAPSRREAFGRRAKCAWSGPGEATTTDHQQSLRNWRLSADIVDVRVGAR